MHVCVCVRALPPQIDSSATCAQRQLPTDGGGIRERERAGGTLERWRERKKRVGEMDRNEKRRGRREKREDKERVGEKGKREWAI